ncbi:MAG TPA: hypothetical protein VGI03_10585 [Verrucomicrobiae bacterium]|jgi:hypothetical protein
MKTDFARRAKAELNEGWRYVFILCTEDAAPNGAFDFWSRIFYNDAAPTALQLKIMKTKGSL